MKHFQLVKTGLDTFMQFDFKDYSFMAHEIYFDTITHVYSHCRLKQNHI